MIQNVQHNEMVKSHSIKEATVNLDKKDTTARKQTNPDVRMMEKDNLALFRTPELDMNEGKKAAVFPNLAPNITKRVFKVVPVHVESKKITMPPLKAPVKDSSPCSPPKSSSDNSSTCVPPDIYPKLTSIEKIRKLMQASSLDPLSEKKTARAPSPCSNDGTQATDTTGKDCSLMELSPKTPFPETDNFFANTQRCTGKCGGDNGKCTNCCEEASPGLGTGKAVCHSNNMSTSSLYHSNVSRDLSGLLSSSISCFSERSFTQIFDKADVMTYDRLRRRKGQQKLPANPPRVMPLREYNEALYEQIKVCVILQHPYVIVL